MSKAEAKAGRKAVSEAGDKARSDRILKAELHVQTLNERLRQRWVQARGKAGSDDNLDAVFSRSREVPDPQNQAKTL